MNPRELKFDPASLRYAGIIGTGGIGTGKFFVLNGDQTLGREESRSGHFLDIRDYCKQHIILHYVKVLMGPSFPVIPVGKVGDDDTGQALLREMAQTGFIMDRVEIVPGASTLFSFCFTYPDGSGGNLTTDNSASAQVDEAFIEKPAPDIQKLGAGGMIMAAPEVPLAARKKLVEKGKECGAFCSASFTTEEIRNAFKSGMIAHIDLVSVNIDEAAALTGSLTEKADFLSVAVAAVQKLKTVNKHILVAVTGGKQGSWCWDGRNMHHFPAIKTEIVSTAGAGDAFVAGLLCGTALGLGFHEAQQLATLLAGLSVTSPHTIHHGIDRQLLCQFMKKSDLKFSDTVMKLLEE